MALFCGDLNTGYNEDGLGDSERFLRSFDRVMVRDGNRIEPLCLGLPEDLLDTALTVFGITGMHVQIAGKHLIIVFLSLWY